MSSAERVLPVLLALCLAASALFFLIPGADAAESDYDEDLGAFYGYELRLIYSGSGATSVTWDFGDGSETAEGLNVTHRYEETGVYIVTQTAANEKGSSVAKYRVEIMGYPQIIYDLGYDGRTLTINQSGWNIAPELPDDPVRPGYRFDGWYTDTALTEPLNLEAGVDIPLTVYAKWTATGGSGDKNRSGYSRSSSRISSICSCGTTSASRIPASVSCASRRSRSCCPSSGAKSTTS